MTVERVRKRLLHRMVTGIDRAPVRLFGECLGRAPRNHLSVPFQRRAVGQAGGYAPNDRNRLQQADGDLDAGPRVIAQRIESMILNWFASS